VVVRFDWLSGTKEAPRQGSTSR